MPRFLWRIINWTPDEKYAIILTTTIIRNLILPILSAIESASGEDSSGIDPASGEDSSGIEPASGEDESEEGESVIESSSEAGMF